MRLVAFSAADSPTLREADSGTDSGIEAVSDGKSASDRKSESSGDVSSRTIFGESSLMVSYPESVASSQSHTSVPVVPGFSLLSDPAQNTRSGCG